jgi:hypothetical protein
MKEAPSKSQGIEVVVDVKSATFSAGFHTDRIRFTPLYSEFRISMKGTLWPRSLSEDISTKNSVSIIISFVDDYKYAEVHKALFRSRDGYIGYINQTIINGETDTFIAIALLRKDHQYLMQMANSKMKIGLQLEPITDDDDLAKRDQITAHVVSIYITAFLEGGQPAS